MIIWHTMWQAEAHHSDQVHSECNGNGVCQSVGGQWQWVNYFLHTGHLSISGLKMSKSLKNFITIRYIPPLRPICMAHMLASTIGCTTAARWSHRLFLCAGSGQALDSFRTALSRRRPSSTTNMHVGVVMGAQHSLSEAIRDA